MKTPSIQAPPAAQTQRTAFTFLEIVIVVAVIGIAVGLLLPAVQAARERARAMSCQNNLGQLWLAVQSYQSVFDVYPAGTVAEETPVRWFPAGYHHSWLTRVRPFLAAGNGVERQLDRTRSVYAAANLHHAEDWALAVMRCPSSYLDEFGTTDYAAIHDGRDAPIDETSGGAFIANRFLRRDDFSDGLSYTMFLSDMRGDRQPTLTWLSGTQTTLRSTALPIQLTRLTEEDEPIFVAYGGFRKDPRSYLQVCEVIAEIEGLSVEEVADADESMQTRLRASLKEWAYKEMIAEEEAAEASEADFDDAGLGMGMGSTEMMEDEFSAGRWGTGFGYSGYPAPIFGAANLRPRGIGSFHGHVQTVMGDGRTLKITASTDRRLLSQLGIRNDAQPLQLPPRLSD